MKKSVTAVVLQTLSLFIPFAVSTYFNACFTQNYLVAAIGTLDFVMLIGLPLLWSLLSLAAFLIEIKPDEASPRSTQRVVLSVGLGITVLTAIVLLSLDTYRLPSSFYYTTCYSITVALYLIGIRNLRDTSPSN